MSAAARTEAARRWFVLLAAPLLWAAHFLLVYGATSLEITLRGVAGMPTQVFVALLTLAALVAIAAFGVAAHRGGRWARTGAPEDLPALWRRCGIWLAVLSFWGVLWQALPALTIPGEPGSHHAVGGGANLPPADPARHD